VRVGLADLEILEIEPAALVALNCFRHCLFLKNPVNGSFTIDIHGLWDFRVMCRVE
jgi:hypothetical protein